MQILYHNYFIAASEYWSKYTLNYKDKALWLQYSIFDMNLHMCPNISLMLVFLNSHSDSVGVTVAVTQCSDVKPL